MLPAPTTGTLTDAVLPGASFNSDEFPVELSQTSLVEADEILKATLEEATQAVGGTRAFLALVDMASGELVLRFTTGEGWTDEIRRQRVNVENVPNIGTARRGITRHVVINGKPYWTGDVSADPHYIGFFDDVRSEIAIPLQTSSGGTIGVINIESPLPDKFGEAHAEILAPLCRRAAIIVAMAEHQLREEALVAIGRDLNSAADLEMLIHDVVNQATKILRAEDCSLFLMDEAGEMLELVASQGPLDKEAGQHTVIYRLGEGLTGWVAQNGRVIRVGDPRTDPRWKGVFQEAPPGEVAAMMAVPVYTQRLKTGVLRVVRHRKGSLYFLPQEFTQADEDILVTLAGQLAVAIDRTRLTERLLGAERMAAWGRDERARRAHDRQYGLWRQGPLERTQLCPQRQPKRGRRLGRSARTDRQRDARHLPFGRHPGRVPRLRFGDPTAHGAKRHQRHPAQRNRRDLSQAHRHRFNTEPIARLAAGSGR